MMSLMNNISVPFGSPYSGVSGTYPTWYRSIIDPDSHLYYVQKTSSTEVVGGGMVEPDGERGARRGERSVRDEKRLGEVSGDVQEASPHV